MVKGRNGSVPSAPKDKDAKAEKDVLDVAVQFGGFSAGDETANIGVVIDRSKLNLKKAEHFFCGSRLQIELAADPNAGEDTPDQEKFWKDVDVISSVVDCKRLSMSPKRFGTGLTFQLSEIEVGDLAHLAKHSGRIRCTRIGDAQTKKQRSADAAANASEDLSLLENAEA